MAFDIRTLLVAAALATAICAGARLLLWRMHPAVPGLAGWAWAGGLGALALLLLLASGSVSWLPTMGLAQAFLVIGMLLAWDGFRRFIGQPALPPVAWSMLAAVVLIWIVAVHFEQSLHARAVINAALVALLSALIAHELLTVPKPLPPALRTTGWAYAANAAFFLLRCMANDPTSSVTGPLNPDGVAAFTLLWDLTVMIAVTLGMVLMTAERLQADLDSQANRDPLTGALNRRAFSLIADKELARSLRYGTPLSVLVMDLDEFKRINDHLGHDAGDALLCRFVTLARQILRGEDAFCRFGGEEFVALLPNTSVEQALTAAERVRTAFKEQSGTPETANDDQAFTFGVSIGIGELKPGETIDSLLRRADAALYRAKGMGRNRCELANDPGASTNEQPGLMHARQRKN